MQLKKLLALLLSAALALSLLAGCGGESVARSLLALLDGQYANVSVEMDPDLEADLRQAIRTAESENAGDDAAAIRAALETLLGSKVTFRKLGEGQQGDTAFDLIFYAGSDPDKAAQAAYSQWNPILSNVPDDGKYDTSLAMVETNSGVWMLVKATVEKAGTVDKPDKDDEPDPVTLKSLTVTGPSTTNYEVGDKFDPNVLTVTATYSNGSTKAIDLTQCTLKINDQLAENYQFTSTGQHTITVSFGGQTATVDITVSANPHGYYEDTDGTYFVTGSNGLQKLFDTPESDALSANIILKTDQTVTGTFGDFLNPFTGTLQSEAGKKYTITLSSKSGQTRTLGLFDQVGNSRYGGTVKNLKILLAADISFTGDTQNCSGAVAGTNYGTIQNCDVDLNGYSITDTYGDGTGTGARCAVGGIAGENQGTIRGCSVSMGAGKIAAKYYCGSGGAAAAGGIAGSNTRGFLIGDFGFTATNGTVTDCTVTGSGTITATLTASSPGEYATKIAAAGGLVGYNDSDGAVSGTYSGTITAQYNGGGPVSATDNPIGNIGAGNNCAYAGTKIGYQVTN
ncbi:hypothetical protein B5G28_09570 [Faecalibacterium sp. An77]|uniref:bacterial Ig-like domain-containing protein n=1 Tax=Faecalibacterium sp. An77 TaxID=1965655 RepID=UPI000B384F49|nr:bacterial Ig-like domain-containing protein [Faecalibacterium sp. An77]OUN38178.1 hypothetical protein B5G28_09570 [Faecalibacterium sp. An77]